MQANQLAAAQAESQRRAALEAEIYTQRTKTQQLLFGYIDYRSIVVCGDCIYDLRATSSSYHKAAINQDSQRNGRVSVVEEVNLSKDDSDREVVSVSSGDDEAGPSTSRQVRPTPSTPRKKIIPTISTHGVESPDKPITFSPTPTPVEDEFPNFDDDTD